VPTLDLPIRFTVAGVPVSQQCRRAATKLRWKSAVKGAALNAISADATPKPLRAEIFYFYLQGGRIDLDNIAKPICDALKKIIYTDDGQIHDLHLRKIDLLGNFHLPETPGVLARAIQKSEDFVYLAFFDMIGV
jgi:crossover junction endodeoxyribonuclease RusA